MKPLPGDLIAVIQIRTVDIHPAVQRVSAAYWLVLRRRGIDGAVIHRSRLLVLGIRVLADPGDGAHNLLPCAHKGHFFNGDGIAVVLLVQRAAIDGPGQILALVRIVASEEAFMPFSNGS